MTYATAGTEIIFEQLDDEVIVANLDEGIYYSIRGSGVVIWQLLLAGYAPGAIDALFAGKYGKVPSSFSFIARLVEERLLVEEERPVNPVSIAWPAEFSLPTLERYDEMKNLLMLDPIHEVDEQGWPSRK